MSVTTYTDKIYLDGNYAITMENEPRTLYNLLRMNWLNDSSISAEPWQVEDYRAFATQALFQSLQKLCISLDRTSFVAYAETVDTPEDLTELLIEDVKMDPMDQDRIYLPVFELWRRLLPEKLSLSIFCDELDHQIYLYEEGDVTSAESIQDAVANLQMIMDENTDQGGKPSQIFEWVCTGCANDLESFLYVFIAEQIDNDNIPYASELLDGFNDYLKRNKWFELLKIRLLESTDSEKALDALRKIVQKATREEDLQFNLEVLSFIVQGGEKGEFNKMVRKTIPLLEVEEDFQELLSICGDFYRCLDEDQKEQTVLSLLEKRFQNNLRSPIKQKDTDLEELLKTLK